MAVSRNSMLEELKEVVALKQVDANRWEEWEAPTARTYQEDVHKILDELDSLTWQMKTVTT